EGVTDSGRGFDPVALEAGAVGVSGVGIPTIRERAVTLGGRLDIESEPGGGSTFRLTLPLANGS
ncbi:MAG: sensor histidine kinase, partial [Phycisphaerae bacterium]|nr:sensor histidine kinase [Phycisphaerae bacterium]